MRGESYKYRFERDADTAGAGLTMSFPQSWPLAAGLPALAAMLALGGGCAQAPAGSVPAAPPAAAETPATGNEQPAPTDPVEPADAGAGDSPAASPRAAAPPSPVRPAIAVGPDAREAQYASLVSRGRALVTRDLGYFIDVHEARLRQALTGTPVRMQRDERSLRLTIPGNESFATGSTEILQSAMPALVAIAAVILEFDKTLVSVHGHTDRLGDSDYNRILSERRAVAVASFLADRGVDRMRLVGVGHGEELPIAEGESEAARAANRRIEILIEPVVDGGQVASVTQ